MGMVRACLTLGSSLWSARRPRRTNSISELRIVLDSVVFWNEQNNKSHWDFEHLDPDWTIFSDMVKLAADAVRSVNPQVIRVLGGISPIDPHFVSRMQQLGTLDVVNAI